MPLVRLDVSMPDWMKDGLHQVAQANGTEMNAVLQDCFMRCYPVVAGLRSEKRGRVINPEGLRSNRAMNGWK